jgi:rhodanese-related sulfurtransferase
MFKISLNIIYTLIVFTGIKCITDNIIPPLTGELNPVGEMLVYFESQGDFANSDEAPALVNSDEIFANTGSYHLIDIRDSSDFTGGHIEGAVNINTSVLFNYMKNIDAGSYPKIVLISKNGHSSAYFTCLLRLAGFNNVYSMNYGMASWNMFFAGEWLDAIGDHPGIFSFTNEDFPRNNLSNLPEVIFENPQASIKEKIEERIKKIIEEGFNYTASLPSAFNNYLVCYGNDILYFARRTGTFPEMGHAAGTVLYLDSPFFEFRSVNYLQTLPVDKQIYIYDYNGQLSACITAYLNVLGYKTASILFGASKLFYSRMIEEEDLSPLAFSLADIKDYPYVSGK